MLFALYVKIRSILNQWFHLKYDFLNFFGNNIQESSNRWIFYNVICFFSVQFSSIEWFRYVLLQEINLKKCRAKIVPNITLSRTISNIWYLILGCWFLFYHTLCAASSLYQQYEMRTHFVFSLREKIPKTEQKNSSHTWLCLSSVCCDVYSKSHFFSFHFHIFFVYV